MNILDKPTDEEKELLKEVENSASETLEDYLESWAYVRKLGNALLKTASKIESELDTVIMIWNEKIKSLSLNNLHILQRYQPLLSKMFFMGKANALAEYGLLKKQNKLHKRLIWLNEERNRFAHYSVYKYSLVHTYATSTKRIKTLRKLKLLLKEVVEFKKDVGASISNPKEIKLIKKEY